MDWFWGTGGNGGKGADPYKSLDPSLREFLDKETPARDQNHPPPPESSQTPDHHPSTSASAIPSQTPSTNYRGQLGLSTPGVTADKPNAGARPDGAAVPAESLFQDGRYAHLWKSYRPQGEVEAASRSDQDRLADVAEAYRDRKAAIGRAALENCVVEQMAEKECFKNGDWKQTMSMCRAENKAFNRCYTMQARFLKALGYLSNAHRSREEEERIQMHADKLFHEMLERERVQKEAREAGVEAPPASSQPLIRHESIEKALGEDSAWSRTRRRAQEESVATSLSQFSPERQADIRDKIKGMSEQERELELQLIAAEARAQFEYTQQIKDRLAEERQNRSDRREQGKETIGDAIKRAWGWDKES